MIKKSDTKSKGCMKIHPVRITTKRNPLITRFVKLLTI